MDLLKIRPAFTAPLQSGLDFGTEAKSKIWD